MQARVIPNLDPVSIENNGERLFYQAAAELPADYTVFYSCKYVLPGDDDHPDLIKEADFVIVHPALGYLVVEVKQGEIMYRDGCWWEHKDRDYIPIRKDPLQQAQQAMFAILDAYNVFTWTTMEEERKSIEKEIGRLVSQGVKLSRIAILSPNIKEKSCLAGMDHIKEWPLGGVEDRGVIRFSTIRSFKGLEADIVFLVDIREGTLACTGTDVYVGASRGRYLLYVFHHAGMDIRSIKTLGQC